MQNKAVSRKYDESTHLYEGVSLYQFAQKASAKCNAANEHAETISRIHRSYNKFLEFVTFNSAKSNTSEKVHLSAACYTRCH